MTSKDNFSKYFNIIDESEINNFSESEIKMRFVTHDGQFHLDDLAASVIFSFLGDEKRLFIRTRNQDVINMEGGIMFDVGGKYEINDDKVFLDHHQRGFDEKWNNKCKNKMAAFGLVLKHYGEKALSNLVNEWNKEENFSFDLNDINKLIDSLYCHGWGKKVDASDNGQFESIIVSGEKTNKKIEEYILDRTSLNFKIKRLYPKWWNNNNAKVWNDAFVKAFEIVRQDLMDEIYYIALNIQNDVKKKSILKKSFKNRKLFHSSGNFLYLSKWIPYYADLLKLEKEQKSNNKIKFVIYKEKGQNKFLIQSFNNRKLFTYNLRGLNSKNDKEKIKELCNLDNISFIHNSGHIAGANTIMDAIKLCEFVVNKN